jgi:hypothetical protein
MRVATDVIRARASQVLSGSNVPLFKAA